VVTLLQTLAVTRRILLELLRSRRILVLWAVFPALMLVLFGLIYAGQADPAAAFARTAPKILVGAALFFSCLGGPVATLVAERENGTLRRLLLSRLSGASYFLGVVGAFVVVGAAQSLVVCGIAAAFGARFLGSCAAGALIVLLSIAAYCGLGFCFGTFFARRTEDVNGPIAAFGVPLLVLGGTFFPIEILPASLLAVAQFNPVFHMNAALVQVTLGAPLVALAGHITVLAAFAGGAVALGVASYRHLLRTEQNA
jgi:ABC-2 type transport system permease protein